MSWLRSRLFWKITVWYAVMSAIALTGMLLVLQSQLETQHLSERQAEIEQAINHAAQHIHSGRDREKVLAGLKSQLADGNLQLWVVDRDLVSLADTSGNLPPDEFAVRSVVNTAIVEGRSVRRIRIGPENIEVIAIAVRNGSESPGSESQTFDVQSVENQLSLILGIFQTASVEDEAQTVKTASRNAAIVTWFFGVLCCGLVAAGVSSPVSGMAAQLSASSDPLKRHDILLSVSERTDELGLVAWSIREMEQDRQSQISSLQNAERVARSSADLLSAVLESLVDGVIAIDPEQRIVFLNSGARRLMNISPAIQLGHRLYEAIRIPVFLETVQDAVRRQSLQTVEYRIVRDSLDLALTVIPIEGGPHAGAVAVIRDISESRRLEAMRRDFVSGVSHELKTPLTVIQACTDTLLDGAMNDPDSASHFLKQIQDQSDRLQQLIFSMLHLARIESGQQLIHTEPIAVHEILDNVLKSLRTVADSRGIVLSQCGSDELYVNSDARAVLTILNNLISNGLNYTDQGGSVTVELVSKSERTQTPAIIVRDTGIGIPPALLDRIFERFYRVDRDRSRHRGGSGLGLAIVKHLCQLIGARISVVSHVRKGSEFKVEFPDGGV